MLGIPANDTSGGLEVRGLVAEWRDGFFVLDKWQVTRKFTLDYGIRYELPTVPYTVNGNASELNAQQTAVVPSNPPVKGFHFINPNHNDWAPRLGFAYRLDDKTVVRGGGGIYYNPNQTNSYTFLNANPPVQLTHHFHGIANHSHFDVDNPFGGAAPPSLSLGPITYPLLTNMTTEKWNQPTAGPSVEPVAAAATMEWRRSGSRLSRLPHGSPRPQFLQQPTAPARTGRDSIAASQPAIRADPHRPERRNRELRWDDRYACGSACRTA